MKTTSALAAQLIRKELKVAFPTTKFQVHSRNFAGGDAIDIEWVDGPTDIEVQVIAGKYEYGHFDGMTDCYECSNIRKDIPQAKYVHTRRTYSEQTYQEHFNRIKESYSGCEDMTDMDTYLPVWQATARQLIWRELQNTNLTIKEDAE